MRIRSFIIAYALVLAIVLFADRRPNPAQQDRYSHIVDLTDGQSDGQSAPGQNPAADSRTRIIAPDSLIPGTWTASQIPPERLIAPLVVMDLNVAPPAQISLDDIAAWETQHGAVPQGAVVAIRQPAGVPHPTSAWVGSAAAPAPSAFPITDQAAQFLMDARYTTGFAIDESSNLQSDRALARQIALHGNYVVEGASHLAAIPTTGSLIVVAPARNAPPKDKKLQAAPVRVLAMVR
ncbi:MAG: cyclase family protein [Terriglobales bacterium]